MPISQFGNTQIKIMQVLWDKGKSAARDITNTLNEIEPVAHSTVQTLLRRMERKGAITHDTEKRTFLYYPVSDVENVRKEAVRNLIENLFDGSSGNLVSFLIKNKFISSKKVKKIGKRDKG